MNPKAGDWVIVYDAGSFRIAQVYSATYRKNGDGQGYDWYVVRFGGGETRGVMRNEIKAVLQTGTCHCQVRLA
jgi:hypothetical protein